MSYLPAGVKVAPGAAPEYGVRCVALPGWRHKKAPREPPVGGTWPTRQTPLHLACEGIASGLTIPGIRRDALRFELILHGPLSAGFR